MSSPQAPGGKTGDDKTLAIDLDGAVKAMEAADKAGVKRFVMVSALHTDTRSAWKASGINGYYIAKHYADRQLRSSGLDYTILRPGLLLDEKASETITTENPEAQKGVSREDVANLILAVLEHDNSIGKVITFNQGSTPNQGGGQKSLKDIYCYSAHLRGLRDMVVWRHCQRINAPENSGNQRNPEKSLPSLSPIFSGAYVEPPLRN